MDIWLDTEGINDNVIYFLKKSLVTDCMHFLMVCYKAWMGFQKERGKKAHTKNILKLKSGDYNFGGLIFCVLTVSYFCFRKYRDVFLSITKTKPVILVVM